MEKKDFEYTKQVPLSDWLKSFADRELKKANPFDDIKNLFKQKNDVTAVENRVRELRELIGLDKIGGKKEDIIPGGRADGEPDNKYDKKQLEKGKKVELEHTDNPQLAKEIAKDHLEESRDFENGKGGKYYDKLDSMEEDIKKELKETKATLKYLLNMANKLENRGEIEAVKILDNLIKKIAKSTKDEGIFDKFPKLKKIINNICSSRGGFVDTPAIMHMLQGNYLKDEKLTEDDKDNLKGYIRDKIKETKKDMDDSNGDDDISEMSYVVFVVDEDKDNNDIFDVPGK